MGNKTAVAYVKALNENTMPFASEGGQRYDRHWNPTSTEYTSTALPFEPSC
jgi:hypothetical protein